MEFDISDLPDPRNRSAQEWVDFYLDLENAIAMGQSNTMADGRSITHHDIEKIVRLRKDWQAKVAADAAVAAGRPTRAPININ